MINKELIVFYQKSKIKEETNRYHKWWWWWLIKINSIQCVTIKYLTLFFFIHRFFWRFFLCIKKIKNFFPIQFFIDKNIPHRNDDDDDGEKKRNHAAHIATSSLYNYHRHNNNKKTMMTIHPAVVVCESLSNTNTNTHKKMNVKNWVFHSLFSCLLFRWYKQTNKQVTIADGQHCLFVCINDVNRIQPNTPTHTHTHWNKQTT